MENQTTKLTYFDETNILRRLPAGVIAEMRTLGPLLFLAGGFIRACVANEPAQDVDLFVRDAETAEQLALRLAGHEKLTPEEMVQHCRKHVPMVFLEGFVRECVNSPEAHWRTIGALQTQKIPSPYRNIWWTQYAFSIRGMQIPVQVIHRWTFETPEQAIQSFDFTIAKAALWIKDAKDCVTVCDECFYSDLAAKRLVYTSPNRIEECGGSILRVLKFYQRGYRIPLSSFAGVIARITTGVKNIGNLDEAGRAKILCGLLREVDPNAFQDHEAYISDGQPQA